MKSIVAVSLVALTALAATGAASAGNGRGHGRGQLRRQLRHDVRRQVRRDLHRAAVRAERARRAKHARRARKAHGIHYAFVGRLPATPANGRVSIDVVRGNHAALRAMLGQPVTQTFAYGDGTEFLKWSQGKPAVVVAGDLAAGDYVRINLRAPRGTALADLEKIESPLIGDHGTRLGTPAQPLFLFRGTLTAVGSSSVTVDVTGGNSRAMRLLVGASRTQTFATGGDTVVLLWQGKVPSVVALADLKVGDRIVVRSRADRGSTLAQVVSSPAGHVADHERRSAS